MKAEYVCNLVVPGAAKSGTSSLHDLLGSHPLICMSSVKEPHHFCRDDRYVEGAAGHNALFMDRPGADYRGESSTGYLPWPEAAKRVARDLKNPRAIILLRDPVSRCFSHYRWRYRLGVEKRSFLEALKNDTAPYDPLRPTGFGYANYLEFSRYSRQVPVWQAELGHENCFVLNSDDLRHNRADALSRCFSFLGLPEIVYDDQSEKNRTDQQGRRPSSLMSVVAKILPASLRSSSQYRYLKSAVLRTGAPVPPERMTPVEQSIVETALSDDIAWFNETFGPVHVH